MTRWFCASLAALLCSCTGTDYIADPPMAVEPRVRVSPDMAAVQVGFSRAFTATFFDDAGEPVAAAQVRWSVSDAQVASIDDQGVLVGLSEGQVTIVAQVGDVRSDSILVGVVDDSDQVAVVRAGPTMAQVEAGETLQLSVESRNALDDVLADKTYVWSSSDEGVASVSAGGLVTALAPGQAVIQAAVDGITSNAVRISVPGGERTGAFAARPNSSYRCEGTAVLRPAAAGGVELFFAEDFLVSQGPRLEVFLSTTSQIGPGSINVGPLQSTIGAQTYALPEGAQLTDYHWVIIHCVPFNISFGFAQFAQ